MKFETKRARAERLKKQKKSTIAGMTLAVLVIFVLAFVLWRSKADLAKKNAVYEAQIAELQTQIKQEEQRGEELSDYQKYVQTKKYMEEIAKNKFGLIYPDEIVFKPN